MKMEPSTSPSEAEEIHCGNCAILEQKLEEAITMRNNLLRSEEFAWKEIERLRAQVDMLKSFLDD